MTDFLYNKYINKKLFEFLLALRFCGISRRDGKHV